MGYSGPEGAARRYGFRPTFISFRVVDDDRCEVEKGPRGSMQMQMAVDRVRVRVRVPGVSRCFVNLANLNQGLRMPAPDRQTVGSNLT
jgi:hypothetical protein